MRIALPFLRRWKEKQTPFLRTKTEERQPAGRVSTPVLLGGPPLQVNPTMLTVAMPNPSDSTPEMSAMPAQFHRANKGCFSLEQLRDLYPDRAQSRGSPLNPRHNPSPSSSGTAEPLSGSGSRVVILRSPLDSLERRRSPGFPVSPGSLQHHNQQHHRQYPQQHVEQSSQQSSPDHTPRLQRSGRGSMRRLSQDGSHRSQRPYASPPPARRAASEAATPELRLDAEMALQHVRGVAKSRLGQQSVLPPHRRCNSEVPLADADADTTDSHSSYSRHGDDDSVEIFFFDAPAKKGVAAEPVPSLADCWPMAGRNDSGEPGTPEVHDGPGPKPSLEGSLAPAQSCPAEMESGKARMPSIDDLRPSMSKSASVSESQMQEKPRKLKTLRSILVERDNKLQHARSLGRRVSFNNQVEVFVYL